MRSLLLSVVFAVLMLPGIAAAQPSSVVPPETAKLLAQIKAADTDLLAVSEEDGRFLRLMAASNGATRPPELGGANS